MISVAFLVILFSVQKYGTSKVGLAVGPALFLWFCSLAGIGIYNLVKYDSSVLRAFNPVYIFYFFKRNSTKAWYSLGGCLLCATGNQINQRKLDGGILDSCYICLMKFFTTLYVLVYLIFISLIIESLESLKINEIIIWPKDHPCRKIYVCTLEHAPFLFVNK